MMHDLIQGHQITSNSPASSFLVIDSADRSTANSTSGQSQSIAPITQPFNNFKLQKPQALLQGGFKSLKLTEIRFPYAIPNVLPGVNNSFWITLVRDLSGDITTKITIPAGFNTFLNGDALATAVQTALNASTVGSAAGTTWTVYYQDGGIIITADANPSNYDFLLFPINPANVPGQYPDWNQFTNYSAGTVVAYQNSYWTCATASVPFSPQTSPAQYQPPSAPAWTVGNSINSLEVNSLLDVMGFDPISNWAYLTEEAPLPNDDLYRASSWAPLTYTSYIDFVSNNLTKYQEVGDSSSKTNSTGAVILRLFLNDETSTVPVRVYDNSGNRVTTDFGNAGSFPFVIHRQFICPKVFKWNPGASIDVIDLQLFDDRGLPLQVPEEGLPNFQITFLATEE
jgi:hypothetical protein